MNGLKLLYSRGNASSDKMGDDNEDDKKSFPEDSPIPSHIGSMSECVDWVEENLDDIDDAGAYCAHYHQEGPPFHEDGTTIEEHKTIRPNEISEKGVQVSKEEVNGQEMNTIEMPISSTSTDRDKDQMKAEALKSMKNQLESGRVKLYLDHGNERGEYPVLDMIGGFYDGYIEENTLWGKAFTEPDNEDAERLIKKIEAGLPIGWSVGFADAEKDENNSGGFNITDVDLVEVSAVGIPSNPDAVASWKNDIAAQAAEKAAVEIKSMLKDSGKLDEKQEEEEEEDEEENEDEDAMGIDEAIELIADEYDAEADDVIAALENAGIVETEGTNETENPDDQLSEDRIREIVRDELDNFSEDKETGEDDEGNGKGTKPAAKEPAGKIKTPDSGEEDDESSDPEEKGNENGLNFNPKI